MKSSAQIRSGNPEKVKHKFWELLVEQKKKPSSYVTACYCEPLIISVSSFPFCHACCRATFTDVTDLIS